MKGQQTENKGNSLIEEMLLQHKAIGNECCDQGYRTLYLTGADLEARMDKADSKVTTERPIHTLSNYACLFFISGIVISSASCFFPFIKG